LSQGTLVQLVAQSTVGGVASWVCDGGAISGNHTSTATCVISGLNGDTTVSATFTPVYNVTTVAPASEGHFSPDSQIVIHGDIASFTVTPEPGYTINTVTGCDGNWTGSNPYETAAVTADCEVTASFTLNTYTVSTTAPVDRGTFDPASAVIDYNQTTTFNVMAETGYTIVSVEGCGGLWTGSNPYITGSITADCEVTASFVLETYLVDTLAEPADQGEVSPTFQSITHGDTADFDITPVDGYQIESVSGCGGVWSGESPYTTGEITAACTVTAIFAEIKEECTFFMVPMKNGSSVAFCL